MHKHDSNRVQFFSKEDLAGGHYLSKGEPILKSKIESNYENINDVLELYNIKLYIDSDVYLKNWKQIEISNFKEKAYEYGKIVGRFMSNINDSNIIHQYDKLLRGYINSFWEIINNQKIYKQISSNNIENILSKEPYIIKNILTYKNVVSYYNNSIRNFLLNYSQSAEILLSIYEVKNDFRNKKMFLPQSLTDKDKKDIISKYLDSGTAELNYFKLIQNARNRNDFKVSDKIRLKAKRRYKEETNKLFKETSNTSLMQYSISISFQDNTENIKDVHIDNLHFNYSYSLNFIKEHNDIYSLYLNFKILFEYIDNQNRINLVSKTSQQGIMERIIGLHSQNEYRHSIAFDMSEIISQAQIVAYSKEVNKLGNSIENILLLSFTTILSDKYNFAHNARLSMPSLDLSFFEKVRLLAPEFESVLKQYKLFVEDGKIDFELLQISSAPSAIKDIPSLTRNKHIYLNKENNKAISSSDLFFSDQTLLAYVEQFKEQKYHTFFDLITNEKVKFNYYEEHEKSQINYLTNEGLLFIDRNNYIQITNYPRILILKDLYENDVASFHHYPIEFQREVEKMKNQDTVVLGGTLFSIPEQNYFNYFLNKSEFTNGLDLRNSYLHGTQAAPEEVKKHENAYFAYLKLLTLVLLKIEDDLLISQMTKMADN